MDLHANHLRQVSFESVHSAFVAQHILPEQRLLADEAGWEGVLAYIKDEDVAERLRGKWTREQGRLTNGNISAERWVELEAEIDKAGSPPFP